MEIKKQVKYKNVAYPELSQIRESKMKKILKTRPELIAMASGMIDWGQIEVENLIAGGMRSTANRYDITIAVFSFPIFIIFLSCLIGVTIRYFVLKHLMKNNLENEKYEDKEEEKEKDEKRIKRFLKLIIVFAILTIIAFALIFFAGTIGNFLTTQFPEYFPE